MMLPETEKFARVARLCVDSALEKGLVLRVLGAVGVYLKIANRSEALSLRCQLARNSGEFGDLDLGSYGRQRVGISKLLRQLGFVKETQYWHMLGAKRELYSGLGVDWLEVYYDELRMNHTVSFQDRLEADYPSMPLADLLLQKMQRIKLRENDFLDVALLLRFYQLGDTDAGINIQRLAAVLCRDWSFFQVFVSNLDGLLNWSRLDRISRNDRDVIEFRIRELASFLQTSRKSVAWRLRSLIGKRWPWYTPVDEWSPLHQTQHRS